MFYDFIQIQEKLKKKQGEHRFSHTLGVAYTSASLAMRYDIDIEKARLAGLLHDCAKHMKAEKLIKYCQEHNLIITKAQEIQPFLLHAPVGADLALNKYGIQDKEISDAIRWHTTGRPAMSMLEKIVYVADYIEPDRNRAPNLSELRRISFENLDMAVCMIARQTLAYLKEEGGAIDEATVKTYDFYSSLIKQ